MGGRVAWGHHLQNIANSICPRSLRGTGAMVWNLFSLLSLDFCYQRPLEFFSRGGGDISCLKEVKRRGKQCHTSKLAKLELEKFYRGNLTKWLTQFRVFWEEVCVAMWMVVLRNRAYSESPKEQETGPLPRAGVMHLEKQRPRLSQAGLLYTQPGIVPEPMCCQINSQILWIIKNFICL